MRAPEGPPSDLPAPALGGYDAAQVRFAAMAWPMRAAEELRSGLIFRALARAARAASMPDPWPSRFAMAVRDEVRHARLCAAVGARLGAPEPRYDARPVQARLARLGEAHLTRTASLLLVEVAMGETISTYLFRAGRRTTVEPLTRAALGAILGDEVRHQRLGWDALTALWPMLSDALRAAVQREAARGLAAAEQQNARPAMLWLQRRQPFDPAYAALGVLNPAFRVEAFYFAVERFVVPRLTRLGLDGPLAWKNRYRDTTT
jgi:P-aminobenzoate N-oxygenase AurF